MPSAAFIAKCQAQHAHPRIRFKYDGVDHSEYVLKVSNIHRDWNLAQGVAIVTLRNNDAHWDIFLTTHTELRKKVSIEMYFDGLAEYLPLFTGYVSDAEADYAGRTVTITIKDRIYDCLQSEIREITAPASEVSFNYISIDGTTRNNPHQVSDIVWHILVDYATLDPTQGAGNTDIDYMNWKAWAVAVDNALYNPYDIGCKITYMQSSDVMMRIMQMTESIMWVGGEGRLKFKSSTQSFAGQTYPKASGYILDSKWTVSTDDRKNVILARRLYSPFYDVWNDGGAYYHEHNYGPANFDQRIDLEDRSVWHNGLISLTNWIDERLLRTAPPIREWTLTTQLQGFLEDVGNEIILTGFYSASPYDSIELHLTDVDFDVTNWSAMLKGYYIWGAGELV